MNTKIRVEVGYATGSMTDKLVDNGASAGEILAEAGINTDGYTILVDGSPVNKDYVPDEGDVIMVTKNITGAR